MAQQKLLVVGAGMAALKFLEELIAIAPGRFDITVVGEEPEAGYNRVLLSPLLAGEIAVADVRTKSRDWFETNGIQLKTSVGVAGIDTSAQSARLSNGTLIEFDTAVFATGSTAIRLNLPGSELEGVEVFRSLSDADRLVAAAKAGAHVLVIGGGLLGIEAAYGMKRAGAHVTLLHVMDRLMERQLDQEAACLLKSALEAKGIDVLLRADTASIEGRTRVERVILKDGRVLNAGVVVMAVGVRPRIDVAKSAGLVCNRGIVVDDQLTTSAKNIFSIGECAEHRGAVYGLVEPAYDHARIAASVIADRDGRYGGTVLATNLKVSGVPVFSAGDFEGQDAEHIVWRDAYSGSYRKFVIRHGRLMGVVLVGDTTDALWYRDLIRSGDLITGKRSMLAFGRSYAEAA